MALVRVTDRMTFSDPPVASDYTGERDTYIIAYDLRNSSWYTTNQRLLYFQHDDEFETESAAISFFKSNTELFQAYELQMFPTQRIASNNTRLESSTKIIIADRSTGTTVNIVEVSL